ncbi:unnamed protein product, partial [Iphiclides podalirius]
MLSDIKAPPRIKAVMNANVAPVEVYRDSYRGRSRHAAVASVVGCKRLRIAARQIRMYIHSPVIGAATQCVYIVGHRAQGTRAARLNGRDCP